MFPNEKSRWVPIFHQRKIYTVIFYNIWRFNSACPEATSAKNPLHSFQKISLIQGALEIIISSKILASQCGYPVYFMNVIGIVVYLLVSLIFTQIDFYFILFLPFQLFPFKPNVVTGLQHLLCLWLISQFNTKDMSPMENFGFPIAACHAKIAWAANYWEESWFALYSKHRE